MKTKTKHLLHLAAAALFLYTFAFTARTLGSGVAFTVLLPLGVVAELAFWIKLFTSDDNVQADRPSA